MDTEKAFNGLLAEAGRHLSVSAGDRSFRGFFVGFKPREYLIIDVPRTSEISDWLNGCRTVIGSFCTAGTMVQFKSSVTDFIRRAAWLLIVTYPGTLEKMLDLRKSYRADCSLPCKLVTVSGLKEYTGLMENVSTGGCKCILPSMKPAQAKMLDLEKEVLLEFELPGSSGRKRLLGEVLHVERSGSEITLAIRFSGDNDVETTEELSAYISKMIRSVRS